MDESITTAVTFGELKWRVPVVCFSVDDAVPVINADAFRLQAA